MTNKSKADVLHGNILVVDDVPANLTLLAGMLKEKGHRVRPVPSGKLALKAVENEPPDLILLDITMPEMNGFEVCKTLKADTRFRDIPIIFISALTETLDKVQAFSSGGIDYVTKPFQFDEVEARVETHLKLHRYQSQLEVLVEKQVKTQYERAYINLKNRLKSFCGLSRFNAQFISGFIHCTNQRN